MSEKINFNFAPSTQTTDEAILEQKAAELRMDRALGKNIDESELQAVNDMQNVFANRQPAGSYNEYIDVKEKNPLEVGLFPGDVFYKKEVKKTKATNPDGTPKYTFKEGSQHTKIRETNEEVLSEKVYSITARRVENGTVFVTLVTAKNTESGVDETQLLSEEEARKVLADAELVDSGIDREHADTISAGSIDSKGEKVVDSEEGGDNAQEETLTEEEEKYAQIFADASSLDRVQMLNAAYGNNKSLSLTEAGTKVLEDLDKAKGKKAAEIVRLAIENGYVLSKDSEKKQPDTYTVDEATVGWGRESDNSNDESNETAKASSEPKEDEGSDLGSLSLSLSERRKIDATKTYRQLTDTQLERLLRTLYGDAKFDDESEFTKEEKLENSRNISDDQAAEELLKAVDQKNFRLTPEELYDQMLVSYYKEIASSDPKELARILKKFYGRKEYKKMYKDGKISVEIARDFDGTSIVEIMNDLEENQNYKLRQDILNKISNSGSDNDEILQKTPQSNHPELGDLPGSFGEQQTKAIDINDAPTVELERDALGHVLYEGDNADTEPININSAKSGLRNRLSRIKESLDRRKELSRKDKFRLAIGALATGTAVSAAAWLTYRHNIDAENIKNVAQVAKNTIKSSPFGSSDPQAFMNLGSKSQAAAEALSHIPVSDGSGGYELLNTINQTLHVNIPKEIWDQHQYEFAAKFKDYVVSGPNGEVWLKDIDPNSGISHYDLSRMKDVIASWTQSR